MSDGYFAGVSANAASAISNWRRWCHLGQSVVPVDFYREVDRFEVRPPPLPAWGEAVEAIYRKDLAADPRRASVIVHEVFGGLPGSHKKARVSRVQVTEIMASFGREIDAIDMFAVQPSKIPQAEPMATFDELRMPVLRDKPVREQWVVVDGALVRAVA